VRYVLQFSLLFSVVYVLFYLIVNSTSLDTE
jgi:hypothetical protein